MAGAWVDACAVEEAAVGGDERAVQLYCEGEERRVIEREVQFAPETGGTSEKGGRRGDGAEFL
jgi:hypothetical protein